MDNFTVLLDAPDKPVSRIQIAKLGHYEDPRYGEFDITADNVDNWRTHLSKLPGGEALVDFEHRSERKPRDSVAAGWISDIQVDGDRVMADARWTPKGEQAIANEEYRFLSPVFGPTQVEGETLEDALPSVALTNKPFLASMPAVCLASDERVSEAIDEDPALRFQQRALDGEYGEQARALVLLDVSQAERDRAKSNGNSLPDGSYPINNTKQLHAAAVLAASKHGDYQAARSLIKRRARDMGVDVATLPGFGSDSDSGSKKEMSADSRPANMDTAEIIKMLDLPEDASEDTIRTALSEQKTKADEAAKLERKLAKKPVKTLEAQATEAGLVLLDAGEVRTLQLNAAAGAEALKELRETRFERAFDKAVEQRKATPAERESLEHFYALDADATLKMLDAREAIMPEKPQGRPSLDLTELDNTDPEEIAREGLEPESVKLDAQIRKYMQDKNLGPAQYPKVLEQVMNGTVQL